MQNLEEYLKKVKNKKLLIVFPHPDDESFNTGGLVQRAKTLSFEIEVIVLTLGGRGKNHKKDKKGDDLVEIRRGEFLVALERLGVTNYLIWEYADGDLKEDRAWVKPLEKEITKFNPGLVVTYDHSGLSGHPDHIALSLEVFRILKKIGKVKLLWAVWPGILRRFMVNKEVKELVQSPNLRLDLTRQEHNNKCKAMSAHESQMGNLRWWEKLILKHSVCAHEYFAIAAFEKEYKYKFVEFKF